MGLPSFPSPPEGGVLPLLVMNTVLSVALLKNMVRHVLHVVGAAGDVNSPSFGEDPSSDHSVIQRSEDDVKGRASRFRDEEEVSELTCKHFFHKACLEKWFDKQHRTCPLCRTIL
ncbi:hypothetical protein RJ640_016058 [Escallonia rubra]|uniref:RING-type domain-containing protein n=1 Tax=Escallonia rubra TaxID=112253 RepID=A0AA88S661_9ASTE|nr:hypothetical protein RJ640_016058 [Escallonia rubra]